MSSNINTCIFSGNAIRNPEVKISRNGTEYVTFSIGCNQRTFDPVTGTYQDDAQFVDFIAFGEVADTVKKMVRRGTKVYVESSLEQTKYRDGSGKIRRWTMFRATMVDVYQVDGGDGEKWHASNWI